MIKVPFRFRPLVLGACATATALVLVGAASASSRGEAAGSIPLPAKYQGKPLHVALTTGFPPVNFVQNGKLVGMDADLANAMGKLFGVTVVLQATTLDNFLPGISAGRYQMMMDLNTPTHERAKVVDFVDYALSGGAVGVVGGNPHHYSLHNLCGARVGLENGTSFIDDYVVPDSKKCTAQGKPGLKQVIYPDENSALLALESGRVDATILDTPMLTYAHKKKNKVDVLGALYKANESIGVAKNTGLAQAVQAAMKKLMANGTYERIFKKWAMGDQMVKSPKINNLRG
jgi:polar amino acid transport system substrate-binding protein